MRHLRLFSLEKGRFQGCLFAASQYLRGACKKDGDEHSAGPAVTRHGITGLDQKGSGLDQSVQILAGLCRVLLSHAVLPCRARRLGGLCGTYSPLRTLPVPAHAWKSTSPIPSCGISSHCRAVEGSWGSRSAVQQQRDSKGDTALRRALSPGEQERGSVTNSCTGHSDTSAG